MPLIIVLPTEHENVSSTDLLPVSDLLTLLPVRIEFYFHQYQGDNISVYGLFDEMRPSDERLTLEFAIAGFSILSGVLRTYFLSNE